MKQITSYVHQNPTNQEPVIDQSRVFYVSIRDGDRFGFLLGPFNTHEQALRRVAETKAIALKANPAEATWASFGTCSLPKSLEFSDTGLYLGVLNASIKLEPEEMYLDLHYYNKSIR